MSVSVMVMVIVCLCVCVFVIVCVCVFVIVRQSVSNVDNYLIYTCAETHRIKERDQLYFWKWGNIKSMARKKTPALSNLFLEKAQTWSPLQKNHCIKDRGQFSLTSEKRKTLGWFEHQSKHLKGRSGPRVGGTLFFTEFLNSFVGRKIDWAGEKIILAGGKIILAGGEIILAGGKIILAGQGGK